MTHYDRNLHYRGDGSPYSPSGAAYLEGLSMADDLGAGEFNLGNVLGGLMPMLTPLLGLIPGAGPIIQSLAGPLLNAASGGGGGGAGAAGGAAANPFLAALGQGGAGALGPLTGLLGGLGAAGAGGADGKGGVDAATALLASQAARSSGTDTQTKGELSEIVQKGRQEAAAKQTSDEVRAAVSPELQAIKSQVEGLQRQQNERLRLAEVTRRRRFEELVLRRLDELRAQGVGGGGGRFY